MLAVLGSGGFGEVYRVRHLLLDEDLALKTLHAGLLHDAGLRERFFREARILKKLLHANLVPMREVGEWQGRLYLTMDLCPGETLAALLTRKGRLPMREAISVAIQVLRALEYAHAQGIVHRDLKPANLILSSGEGGGWEVKVLDFGVAKVLRDGSSTDGQEASLTAPGGMIGTLKYMSPEQSQGLEIDARSDLWSLGVVLFEAVTGRKPFEGLNPRETLMKILLQQPPAFSGVGLKDPGLPGLKAVVLRALAKEPAGRPESARALREELEGLGRREEAAEARRGISNAAPNQGATRGSLTIAGLAHRGKSVQGYEEYLHEQTGIVLALLPAGDFLMGSPEDEEGRSGDEVQHKVRLTRPFLLAKFELTNEQFRRFRSGHDSGSLRGESLDGDDQPVVKVSWDYAFAFCEWTRPKLRLPTEAEWEFAARGGESRAFPWGNQWPPPSGAGNYADAALKRLFPDLPVIEGYDDGYAGTSPVGKFVANPFGLYDLGGNVWEWCADWYGKYSLADVSDPAGPESGTRRVLRGGSFMWGDRRTLQCANRGRQPADMRSDNSGLRLALTPGTR
ncbi:MAG: SUMF1/EgtB/PvdO family nonheme iron enzyme [Planctomycetes bacterium]|nr:SUMF1/EgtB/PvdO family nonheme iron enzyme [Planctomycetota bacterium]